MEELKDFIELNLSEKKEQIKNWSQNYYEGNSKISDKDFDLAYKIYLEQGGEDLGIGFGYAHIPGEETFIHYCHPVGSLDNIFNDNVEKAFDKNLNVEVTPKLDGGSCVVYYGDNGKLIRALTRGDKGKYGIDITKNLLHTIPLKIKSGPAAIRGEVCMTWESFEKINKIPGKGHPRNKASGLVGSKNSDPNDIKHLKFIAYDILNSNKLKSDIRNDLQEFNFLIPMAWIGEFKDFINALQNTSLFDKNSGFYKIYNNDKLESLPYDGIVIANNNKRNKVMSGCEWDFYISPSKAFKFDDEMFKTTIIDIEWNMSGLGKFKPVAILEPTNIDGTIIKRATLNNAQFIIDNKYGKGAKVFIVKACSVMPEIVGVIEPSDDFTLPEKCFYCDSKTIFKKRELICSANDCICNDLAMIENLINEYKVKGIGEKNLEYFVEYFKIRSIEDLKNVFRKDEETLADELLVMGVARSKLMMDTINICNHNKPNLATILRISNISDLGEVSLDNINSGIDSEKFIQYCKNQKNDILIEEDKVIEELLFKHCASEPAFLNLINSMNNIYRVLEFFNFEIKNEFVEKSETIIMKINYCLTGTLSKPRKELIEELKMLGAKFTSISKADVLIADVPSEKTKYQTALKKGIKIMTEEEFMKQLKGDL